MRTVFASLVAMAGLVKTANADRTFTVKNNAFFTSGGTAPSHATGWEAAAGSSVSFTVAENWNGRIWGRTGCTFDGSGSPNTCSTGGCNGGLQCATSGGTGVPPASLAEWNLNDAQDWYDNLPMSITNNVGCSQPTCSANINAVCPSVLQKKDSSGAVVGCYTACAANLDGNQADSANCCSGSHNTPATCPSSGVQYYSTFKNACPNAYAYAYDESSASALWTCDHAFGADYTLTFCP
ncbi:hypothetical protein JCM8547_002168 [Rhodosporidiobolus lusitaniae]